MVEDKKNIRVRFAPSPTGEPHIGNLRTALFNWLYARNTGGKFILRIDDTDLKRTVKGAEDAIYESLRWLGLDWDEGPVGFGGSGPVGDFGPYRQSERLGIYEKYLERLTEKDAVYPCFCRDEELERERQLAIRSGKPYRYSGKCRNLSAEQRKALLASSECHSLRIKVTPGVLKFYDRIRGEMSANANDIGDFIIRRSDKIPTYNFTTVVDDALMEISLVIRAEDHLYNTFSQLLVYKALGLDPPGFAHLSLILGTDRKPLSKREQAGSVRYFQEKGYLAEALVNYLGLLGFSHPEAKEFLSKDELIRSFTLNRVSKSAAVFDLARLDWLNRKHLRGMPAKEILKRAGSFLKAAGIKTETLNLGWLERATDSIKENLSRLDEVPEWLKIYLKRPEPSEIKSLLAGASHGREILEGFVSEVEKHNPDAAFDENLFSPLVKSFAKKSVYTIVRLALTAAKAGPELIPLMNILGREEILKRAKGALNALYDSD